MKLVGYIRVSTEEQAQHGASPADQERQLAAYCDLHGHELITIYYDRGVSGSVPIIKRPGASLAIKRAIGAMADGILVTRLDRLFRNTLDGLQFFDAGNAVVSIHEHIDATTAIGRLQLTIQMATAQYEREITAERVKQVSDGLRQRGEVFGHVPFGCVSEPGQGDRAKLLRDPGAWAQRQQIVDWRAEGWTFRAIADRLRKTHVPAPNGGRHWSPSTIRNICQTHDDLAHLPLLTTA